MTEANNELGGVETFEIEYRRVAMETILPLRWTLLIEGTGRDTPQFAGDDGPEARHYAAFYKEHVIACGTCLPSEYEGAAAWQLRGMAVKPGFQGTGVGRRLLAYIMADLRADAGGRERLWCHARTPAMGFYERMGWRAVSEVYYIEEAGPHRTMTRPLGDE